jgi:REP element-mobilizing transposase RayT
MPHGLKRFQQSGQTHFVTFTCYHRRPYFDSPAVYDRFVEALESTRRRFALRVYGYVVPTLCTERKGWATREKARVEARANLPRP